MLLLFVVKLTLIFCDTIVLWCGYLQWLLPHVFCRVPSVGVWALIMGWLLLSSVGSIDLHEVAI